MATCPECFTRKPFWARRCHSCNEFIGFWRQLIAQWVILVSTFGTMYAIYLGFAEASFMSFFVGMFWMLVWCFIWVVPAFPILLLWYWMFPGKTS